MTPDPKAERSDGVSRCGSANKNKAMTKPQEGGWIAWEGGDRPVDGGVIVVAKYRNGLIDDPHAARDLVWRRSPIRASGNADIIAYRLALLSASSGGGCE